MLFSQRRHSRGSGCAMSGGAIFSAHFQQESNWSSISSPQTWHFHTEHLHVGITATFSGEKSNSVSRGSTVVQQLGGSLLVQWGCYEGSEVTARGTEYVEKILR